MALQEELEKQGQWLFKHRSKIPLAILLIGIILYLKTEKYPDTFILEDTPYEAYYEALCLLISLLGLAIRIYTVGHTPKNTSGRNTDEGQVAEVLNTSGSYSVVRHPLYLGNFFMWLGPTMLAGQFWFVVAVCLFFWLYYERIMFAEEQYLRNKFQSQYTDWAKEVPAFIPRFKNFVPPALPFSWKKTIKKEKNGLLAVFLIFTFFNIAGEMIEHQTNYNYFLIGGCILSLLGYVVLKYLKTQTKLLDEEGR